MFVLKFLWNSTLSNSATKLLCPRIACRSCWCQFK